MADLEVVLSPAVRSLADDRSSERALGDEIARRANLAARGLRLTEGGQLTVGVRNGEVENGQFQVTAGGVTIGGQPGATPLPADAGVAEIGDAVAAAICLQRTVLCAAAGRTHPLTVRLARLGAGAPADLDQATVGDADRACERMLAERSGRVLTVEVAHDLAAAIDARATAARIDSIRRWILQNWGVPVPEIPVDVADLPAGHVRVTLLDTPFARAARPAPPALPSTQPGPAGPTAAPEAEPGESAETAESGESGETAESAAAAATEAVMAALVEVAGVSVASLLTLRGTDLLLGALARTDPRLVSAVDDRYTRTDITGILRELLLGGQPITGLRPILGRITVLLGGVATVPDDSLCASLACDYYRGEPGAEPSYAALANAIGPYNWHYTGHSGMVFLPPATQAAGPRAEATPTPAP